MTTIAELSIPAEEFALEETFEGSEGLQIDVVQGWPTARRDSRTSSG